MTHDDVIIQNVKVVKTPDLSSAMHRIDMCATVWYRWDPSPRMVMASMMVSDITYKEIDGSDGEKLILEHLMDMIVKKVLKERDKHREQLSHVHTSESLRSLLANLEKEGALGGYGGSVRRPFPSFDPSVPDPAMGRSHWDVSGSGSGTKYESYDDCWGSTPPGRSSRV